MFAHVAMQADVQQTLMASQYSAEGSAVERGPRKNNIGLPNKNSPYIRCKCACIW
jgi:hypothetical protein